MLHFSKTIGYAVHALSRVGLAEPRPSLVRDIARSTGLKQPYLAQIINQLGHHGLVKSKRGCHGGVLLARPAEEISLWEIARAMEKNVCVSDCLFGLDSCPCQERCPAHEIWGRMGRQIENVLRATRLKDMVEAARRNEQERACAGQAARACALSEVESLLLFPLPLKGVTASRAVGEI